MLNLNQLFSQLKEFWREAKEEGDRLEKEKEIKEQQEKREEEKREEEKREVEKQEVEKQEVEKREEEKREVEKQEEEKQEVEQQEEEQQEVENQEVENQEVENQEVEKQEVEKRSKTPARSRRATRATAAAPPPSAEAEADSMCANDDVPARRTRSRSNSSNSVSSERSASSVSTRGGRGAKRGSSAPPPAASTRGTNRRRRNTASTQQDTNDAPLPPPLPPGTQSRSTVSICSVSSQSRGGRGGGGRGGGRQRGRGRKTEPIPAINIQSEQTVDPTPAARGRGSRRGGEPLPQEDGTEKADPQQAPTTRGRRRANASEPHAAEKQDDSSQECASGESPLPTRTLRGRAVKGETVEAPVAPAVSEGDKEKRKGRKREANTGEASSSSHKAFQGKQKAHTPEEAGETNHETPVPAKRRGRASTAQANKMAGVSSAKVEGSGESEAVEEVPVKKRGRGRPSVAQKKMKEEEEEEDSGFSVDHVEASEPQTPTSAASRKRQALADSSPVAKTPRSASASPGGRLRSVSHAYKVLFTGVVDEEGERVLARLGGRMAKGVADMNCLVTDKVRRTVKFLCAVAKGVPIVTTHWLDYVSSNITFYLSIDRVDPTPVQSPTPTLSPHLSRPERFSGDSGDCRAFLAQCGLHFELQAACYPSERSRVAYIVSHLSGRAVAWATAEWVRGSPVCDSLDLFSETFTKIFRAHPIRAGAARALVGLRQLFVLMEYPRPWLLEEPIAARRTKLIRGESDSAACGEGRCCLLWCENGGTLSRQAGRRTNEVWLTSKEEGTGWLLGAAGLPVAMPGLSTLIKGARREDYPERECSSPGFHRAQMAHSEVAGLGL
ncbi:mediator of DNA damage checkpoint protein 1-like [Notothenia coriiceps]|uniref:Mediator of DNA damage checkpoint protein 1-like n=1 Tax=Notothenia coriiceps TaxID=8208 RepID=A0A6I9PWJ6_9TELE|nr:PREDICTED: mediator of DNA damage checkpoint protein 1-like [Notothenia coriiceps]